MDGGAQVATSALRALGVDTKVALIEQGAMKPVVQMMGPAAANALVELIGRASHDVAGKNAGDYASALRNLAAADPECAQMAMGCVQRVTHLMQRGGHKVRGVAPLLRPLATRPSPPCEGRRGAVAEAAAFYGCFELGVKTIVADRILCGAEVASEFLVPRQTLRRGTNCGTYWNMVQASQRVRIMELCFVDASQNK